MKRMLCLIFCALAALSALSPALALEPAAEGAVTVSAPSCVLIEKQTGGLIYEKQSHERLAPASVTKVMTLLLTAEAVDDGLLAMDDMVTGSSKSASMGGSQVWLEEGEALSVSDMIKCVAVVSANDCAVALAERIAGTEEEFVRRMNERASELGCTDTQFKNCTGLFDDPEHYTSAYDIALMSRELLRHDWIKQYTTIWMDSIRDGASELTNTNKLVRFYKGCTGLKTGYTSGAGYCLSASAERDGTEYIAVIMRSESIASRNADAQTLLNYAFANYSLVSLRSPEALPPVIVELGEAQSVQPVYSGESALLLKKAEAQGLSCQIELASSVPAPVREGDELGRLTVSRDGKAVASVPLVSESDVARLGVFGVVKKLLALVVCSG